MSVSIVVLSRDRLWFTQRCLDTIAETVCSEPVRVVVVDNGSVDGSAEFLTEWSAAGRGLLARNLIDVGSAAARNQGGALTSDDYLCFVDNDVFFDETDWLEKLLEPLREDDAVAAASPTLLFPGSDLVQCGGGGVTRRGWLGQLRRGTPAADAPTTTREQQWAPAAVLLVRRRAWEEAGGFDTAFDPVALLEDVDLCYRMRSAGGTIVQVGAARARHYEGSTFQHLGHDMKPVYRTHERVIRNRWGGVWAAGPFCDDNAVAWKPILKDYEDPSRPAVRVLSAQEAADGDYGYLTSAPTLPAAPPDLRVGVVGCGQVAVRGALPGFATPGGPEAARAAAFLAFDGATGIRVVGVTDLDLDRARTAAAEFHVRHVRADARDLVDTVPLEVVAICAPPGNQAGLATAALDAGMHVLLEKPGAASVEQLDDVMRVRADHPGQACVVNLPWTYHPSVAVLRAVLRDGVIGELTAVDVIFEHAGPEKWAPGAQWYFEQPLHPVVTDLGGHVLAVTEAITNTPVEGLTSGQVRPRSATATATAGTAPVRVAVSWEGAAPSFRIVVTGSGGTASADLAADGSARQARVTVRTESDEYVLRELPAGGAPDIVETEGAYRALVQAARRGSAAATDLTRIGHCLRASLVWAANANGAACTS